MPEWARTVIVIAVPCSAGRVTFLTPRGSVTGVFPPTYLHYRGTKESVRADLETSLLQPRWRAELARVPEKTLATRLGLVAWGRNNVTYTQPFGSYHELVAVLTDFTIESSHTAAARVDRQLAECSGCDLCVSACPTGAIDAHRFLLRAERCLVLYNETQGPWPAWLSPHSHNCLIGCLACQTCCPANAGLLREEDSGVTFSCEETTALLSTDPDQGVVWSSIAAKLEALGRGDDLPVLGRNLRALVA